MSDRQRSLPFFGAPASRGPMDASAERIPLSEAAWLRLVPRFVAPDEHDATLAQLLDELKWEEREIVLFGRRILQPRRVAWAGAVPYRYSGQTLEPRAVPPALEALKRRVESALGEPFNHVLANHYRHGGDSMGLHSDAEPELGPDPQVASLSLGTSRRFQLRRRRADGDGRWPVRSLNLDLGEGALLLMGGACQHEYRHGVPKAPRVTSARISLTFRRVLEPPAASKP